MAQYTRLKKITDPLYINTTPGAEVITRDKLDGPTQEIADMLYSQDAGKGASQVGLSGMSYQNVQALGEAFVLSGSGSLPPSDSIITEMVQDEAITNDKLATDVKVGSLALSTTTDKSSVIAVTNEINTNLALKTNASIFRKFVSLSTLSKSDATLTDVPDISISVEAGKTYKIETFAKYQTTISTTGVKFYHYLPSGAGTIYGTTTIYQNRDETSTSFKYISTTAIGVSGLLGAGLTTADVDDINQELGIYSCLLFKCTSTGVFKHQFASEVAAASSLIAGVTVLVTEV